jgi:G:T-mismatch repair DNA endonuclease (very short patch repair protein)
LKNIPTLTEVEYKEYSNIFFDLNTAEKKGYVGRFPGRQYFNTESMDIGKLAEFNSWYNDRVDDEFDLEATLYEYCAHDVTILRECVLKFRELVIQLTSSEMETESGGKVHVCGMDPFANAVTLPQMCQKIFRYLCLTENHSIRLVDSEVWIPVKKKSGMFLRVGVDGVERILPMTSVEETTFVNSKISQLDPNGNLTNKLFSKISIQYMKYIERVLQETVDKDIVIQHALSAGGERVLTLCNGQKTSVDGWYLHNGERYVLEFHGCFYHSCPHCYPQQRWSTIHPFYGVSLHENYLKSEERVKIIKASGYTCTVMWECDFRKILEMDRGVNTYVGGFDIVERIHPRDALFGGRCEAFILYCNVEDMEEKSEINFFDFTSLYPSVQFEGVPFPVGQYRVITDNFLPIGEYFGIAKVRVIPPTDLYIPVLPYRANGKLMCTLCRIDESKYM